MSTEFAFRHPDKCTAEASRRGELEPCDKPAVAVAKDVEEGGWYPVCAWHANRFHTSCVPLADVLDAAAIQGVGR